MNIKIDKIIRSKRRTLALEIAADASLIVRAPIRTPLDYIDNFIEKKIHWIKEKQELVKKNHALIKPKEFIDGENFLYLGNSYRLKITDKYKKVVLSDFLYLPQNMQTKAQKALISWYKTQALEKITERVNWYANITGLKYESIKVTNAKKRWGSCSSKGRLCFNWRLILSPLNILDYVVVHELAHLEERNHSSRFWNKVKEIMPDHKQKYKWLKENGFLLNI